MAYKKWIAVAEEFIDYPKFGVWPDAYYMTADRDKKFPGVGNFVAAFERVRMLQGLPAQAIIMKIENDGNRAGMNDGRVYLVIVSATDEAGGLGFAALTVTVPKSSSPDHMAEVAAQAAAAKSYPEANDGQPPPGYFLVRDGPEIGPKQ
jgi:hypothetical protein